MSNLLSVWGDKEYYRKAYQDCSFFGPQVAKIKLYTFCNLRCSKCNIWTNPNLKNRENLTLNEIYRVVDELAEMSCQYIKFSGGEVTLLKELPDLIEYASSKGMMTGITTNGTRINGDLANKLVFVGLNRVTVSIDSSHPEVHDKLVGVAGAWQKSVGAVRKLSVASKRNGESLKVRIASVVSKANFRELPEMVKIAAANGAEALNLLSLQHDPLLDHSLMMNDKDIEQFNSEIIPLVASLSSELGIEIDNLYPYEKQNSEIVSYIGKKQIALAYDNIPCFMPWYYIFIRRNGSVHACCFNKSMSLGNVKQQSLKEIIHGQRYKQFRKQCKPPIRMAKCRTCLAEIRRNRYIWNQLDL